MKNILKLWIVFFYSFSFVVKSNNILGKITIVSNQMCLTNFVCQSVTWNVYYVLNPLSFIFKVFEEIIQVSLKQRFFRKSVHVRQINQVNIMAAGSYLLKVNNKDTRTKCKICSKLAIKTPERRHCRLEWPHLLLNNWETDFFFFFLHILFQILLVSDTFLSIKKSFFCKFKITMKLKLMHFFYNGISINLEGRPTRQFQIQKNRKTIWCYSAFPQKMHCKRLSGRPVVRDTVEMCEQFCDVNIFHFWR